MYFPLMKPPTDGHSAPCPYRWKIGAPDTSAAVVSGRSLEGLVGRLRDGTTFLKAGFVALTAAGAGGIAAAAAAAPDDPREPRRAGGGGGGSSAPGALAVVLAATPYRGLVAASQYMAIGTGRGPNARMSYILPSCSRGVFDLPAMRVGAMAAMALVGEAD